MSTARFLLYVRQSLTPDADTSLSLAFQERALRELVKKQGGVVLEPVIVDADEKGWDPNRPGIQKLVDRTEREQPDGVVVYAVSRFARDNWLQEGIWRRLIAVQPEMQFLSATEPHAGDDMMRGILGVISQAERKRMGTFLRSAFAERARNGKAHGRAPFGYARGEDGRLVIVPDERDAIVAMIDRYEAGWSCRRIAHELNAAGRWDRLWQSGGVRSLICNPAIAGGIRCGEVMEWDSHEAIITRERHERLVAQWQTQRVVRTKHVSSWLERLMVCGCGAPMDLNGIGDHNGDHSKFRCCAMPSRPLAERKRGWPDCTSSPRSILVRKAERMVAMEIVKALDQIPDWQDVERRLLHEYRSQQRSSQRDTLVKELQRVNRERDRLLVLYKRATLEIERWEPEDAEMRARIAELTNTIERIPAPPDSATLRERMGILETLHAHVRIVVATDPSKLGAIMRDAGITAQLDNGNVRLCWPDSLAMFFT